MSTRILRLLVFLVLVAGSVLAQGATARSVTAVAATPDGSLLYVAVADTQLSGGSVIALAPSSSRILWQHRLQHVPTTLTLSPNNQTVAVGFAGVPETDPGVLLYAAGDGKQTGALGVDADLGFLPGEQYASWGNGVVGLAFAPTNTVLYGVSNDELFAWDVQAKRYLWVTEVPADPTHAKDGPDLIAFGHTTGLALSPDGRQLAVARGLLRIASAGSKPPVHFIARGAADKTLVLAAGPAFSSDSRILAATYAASSNAGSGAIEYWVGSGLKATRVAGCEEGVVWASQPGMFGCQDHAASHLRNIQDPQKDIGVAGPAGDLPILKVGNSLWSADYKRERWKDPAKPLTVTLGELGTGKRVTFSIPGR